MNFQQIMSNPLFKAALNSGNPKQFLMNYIKTNQSFSNNPMINGIVDDISKGKTVDVASIGRNIAHEAGIENPDKIVDQLLTFVKNKS